MRDAGGAPGAGSLSSGCCRGGQGQARRGGAAAGGWRSRAGERGPRQSTARQRCCGSVALGQQSAAGAEAGGRHQRHVTQQCHPPCSSLSLSWWPSIRLGACCCLALGLTHPPLAPAAVLQGLAQLKFEEMLSLVVSSSIERWAWEGGRGEGEAGNGGPARRATRRWWGPALSCRVPGCLPRTLSGLCSPWAACLEACQVCVLPCRSPHNQPCLSSPPHPC